MKNIEKIQVMHEKSITKKNEKWKEERSMKIYRSLFTGYICVCEKDLLRI